MVDIKDFDSDASEFKRAWIEALLKAQQAQEKLVINGITFTRTDEGIKLERSEVDENGITNSQTVVIKGTKNKPENEIWEELQALDKQENDGAIKDRTKIKALDAILPRDKKTDPFIYPNKKDTAKEQEPDLETDEKKQVRGEKIQITLDNGDVVTFTRKGNTITMQNPNENDGVPIKVKFEAGIEETWGKLQKLDKAIDDGVGPDKVAKRLDKIFTEEKGHLYDSVSYKVKEGNQGDKTDEQRVDEILGRRNRFKDKEEEFKIPEIPEFKEVPDNGYKRYELSPPKEPTLLFTSNNLTEALERMLRDKEVGAVGEVVKKYETNPSPEGGYTAEQSLQAAIRKIDKGLT